MCYNQDKPEKGVSFLELNYQEVEKFYSDLLDTKTPKAQKYLVYQTYAEAKEAQEELKEAVNYFQRNAYTKGSSCVAHKIADILYIVETVSLVESHESHYYPLLCFEGNYKLCFDTKGYAFCTTNYLDAILYGYIYLYDNPENAKEKFNFVKTYLYYASQEYLKKEEEK